MKECALSTSEQILTLLGSDIVTNDELDLALDIVEMGLFESGLLNIEEGIEQTINKYLQKAGVKVHTRKGLIQYLISAGKGLGKLFLAALKGDKEEVKKIAKSVKKEDVIDFLLKLDTVTYHLLTGPIHMIDAVTGWHIWAAIEDKIKNSTFLDKLKQALQKAKELVKTAFSKEKAKEKAILDYIKRIEKQAGLIGVVA